jgi:hypothetical protein
VVANILSHYDSLDAQHISGYSFIYPNFVSPPLGINTPLDVYGGTFHIKGLYPGNTSDSLVAALNTAFNASAAEYPGQFLINVLPTGVYPDFWSWYEINNGPVNGSGTDILIGSRLLGVEALSQNKTALIEALKIVTPPEHGLDPYLVAGRGLQMRSREVAAMLSIRLGERL